MTDLCAWVAASHRGTNQLTIAVIHDRAMEGQTGHVAAFICVSLDDPSYYTQGHDNSSGDYMEMGR